VNLGRLQEALEAGKLDPAHVIMGSSGKSGLIRRVRDGIRLLGKGELKIKVY